VERLRREHNRNAQARGERAVRQAVHRCHEGRMLMPTAPLRPCAYRGCPKLSDSSRCAEHRSQDRRRYDTVTGADLVHHIDGDRWNLAAENLMSLCNSCHSRLETEQRGGFRPAGAEQVGGMETIKMRFQQDRAGHAPEDIAKLGPGVKGRIGI